MGQFRHGAGAAGQGQFMVDGCSVDCASHVMEGVELAANRYPFILHKNGVSCYSAVYLRAGRTDCG